MKAQQSQVAVARDTLGRTVARLRAERGLSQQAVADAVKTYGIAGWIQSTVAKVEAGRRPTSAEEVYALARVLGCTPSAFFAEVPADERVVEVELAGLRADATRKRERATEAEWLASIAESEAAEAEAHVRDAEQRLERLRTGEPGELVESGE